MNTNIDKLKQILLGSNSRIVGVAIYSILRYIDLNYNKYLGNPVLIGLLMILVLSIISDFLIRKIFK